MVRRILFLVVLLAACTDDIPTGPADAALAKGGKPAGSGGIKPTELVGGALNCSMSAALAVNTGPPTVVVGDCYAGGQRRPLRWTAAEGPQLLPLSEGIATDVSDAGSIVGATQFQAFAMFAGSAPALLPVLDGSTHSWATGMSGDGGSAIGNVETATATGSTRRFVRWYLESGTWNVEPFTGGAALAANHEGTVLAGTGPDGATVWTRSGSEWVATTLPDDGALSSQATAINAAGTVVVGVRSIPVPHDPTVASDQHVAWTRAGSDWTLQILQGINLGEGRPFAVADQLDGSTVAVGFTWEDKPGAGAQMWAVYWRMPSGGGPFGAAERLQPLTKGGTALARDVNARGEIVGDAASRRGNVAVMWRLP